jgi:homoserine O-succinyltransferase
VSRCPAAPVTVGLVNIMPPGAMRATDQQFSELLAAACGERNIIIRRFTLDAQRGAASCYEGLATLFNSRLDALIVTGTEPRAATLTEEPCWQAIADLVEWAAGNSLSVIWSCFAAHAAVYRLDAIARQRLQGKLSGIFACDRLVDDPLTAATPWRWQVPHSRYHGLAEDRLAGAGYTILSHSARFGADSFVKQHGESLFLFFQGHPEYAPDVLLGEYRRDLRRFLAGEAETHPALPEHYFGSKTHNMLLALKHETICRPSTDRLQEFDALVKIRRPGRWHAPAAGVYAGWLAYIAQRKATQSGIFA